MRFIIITLISLFSINFSFSQKQETDKKKSKNIKIVPYVSYNRMYEFMLGAVPM